MRVCEESRETDDGVGAAVRKRVGVGVRELKWLGWTAGVAVQMRKQSPLTLFCTAPKIQAWMGSESGTRGRQSRDRCGADWRLQWGGLDVTRLPVTSRGAVSF